MTSVQMNISKAKPHQSADEFKSTDVGDIPVDWEVVEAGDIGTFKGGSGFPLIYQGQEQGDYLFFKVSDLSRPENVKSLKKANHYISDNVRKRLGAYLFPKNTIVFAKVGAAIFLERKRLLDQAGCIDNNMAGFIIYENIVDLRYIYHFLTSFTLGSLVSTTALPSLNGGVLRRIKVPLPRTTEQAAMAEALDHADAHIQALEKLIEKKRLIKKGAMQALLSGRKRLPGYGREWKTKKIGDLLTIKHGKSQKGVIEQNGPYPILATGGEIGRSREFLHDKPSVLIGRKGTIDRPQFMDRPFWTVDTLFYSVVKEPNCAKFLYYAFLLVDWRRHNEASGVPSLNAKTIEQIELQVPPEDEQVAIAAALTDMEKLIEALQARLEKARQIKQGMMQELLTGRVRLV